MKQVVPIKNLNPYASNVVQLKVTSKSDVRTWTNAKGSGKLFNVEFVDKDGDEIKVRPTFYT